jgi:hypothetical protein
MREVDWVPLIYMLYLMVYVSYVVLTWNLLHFKITVDFVNS